MGHSECCMSFQRVCTSRCCVNDRVKQPAPLLTVDTHLGLKVLSCSWHPLVSLDQVPLIRDPGGPLLLQGKDRVFNLADYNNNNTDRLRVSRLSHVSVLLTFPLLVNLWICAVAMPGSIRHTVMTAKPGRISYHMATLSGDREQLCWPTKLP